MFSYTPNFLNWNDDSFPCHLLVDCYDVSLLMQHQSNASMHSVLELLGICQHFYAQKQLIATHSHIHSLRWRHGCSVSCVQQICWRDRDVDQLGWESVRQSSRYSIILLNLAAHYAPYLSCRSVSSLYLWSYCTPLMQFISSAISRSMSVG